MLEELNFVFKSFIKISDICNWNLLEDLIFVFGICIGRAGSRGGRLIMVLVRAKRAELNSFVCDYLYETYPPAPIWHQPVAISLYSRKLNGTLSLNHWALR